MGQISQGLSTRRLVTGPAACVITALAVALTSCGDRTSGQISGSKARAPRPANPIPLLSAASLPPATPPTAGADRAAPDRNGEDDGSHGQAIGPRLEALTRTARAEFQAIAGPPGSHPLICDLTPFAGQLYASFAVQPINLDGAQIHRFRPAPPAPAGAIGATSGSPDPAGTWSLALDWDRGGAPGETHEVGGQGITRVRVIGDRLMGTDADAPLFGGFGLSDARFEDYLFVSDPAGEFPPAGPDFSPPEGTRVLPLAFHVFDVITYRGAVVASGGTVSRIAKGTRYPGGLFVGRPDSALLLPLFRPGEGWPVGVVRTTYMHRFGGRLYAGFQNNERACRWDLAVLTGDPLDPETPAPILARVTEDGGWLTRRFASTDDTLYWIASGYRRDGREPTLFVSSDGQTFTPVPLPPGAGAPQDLAIVGTARFLLTTAGLYRAGPDHRFALIAQAPAGDPFGIRDTFCSAPLAVFDDALYVGSTRDGTLYRITPR